MPIIKTEASRGEGVEELAEKIAEHRAFIEPSRARWRSAAGAT